MTDTVYRHNLILIYLITYKDNNIQCIWHVLMPFFVYFENLQCEDTKIQHTFLKVAHTTAKNTLMRSCVQNAFLCENRTNTFNSKEKSPL